jgi:hypothetical protein
MYEKRTLLSIRSNHLLAPTIALVSDSNTLRVNNVIPQMLRTPTEKNMAHKPRIRAALFSFYAHQKLNRQSHPDVPHHEPSCRPWLSEACETYMLQFVSADQCVYVDVCFFAEGNEVSQIKFAFVLAVRIVFGGFEAHDA